MSLRRRNSSLLSLVASIGCVLAFTQNCGVFKASEAKDNENKVSNLPEPEAPQLNLNETKILLADGAYNHFGNLAQSPEGDLYIVYRKGSDHVSVDGKVAILRSRTQGRSWDSERILVSGQVGTDDLRDPHIHVTQSGLVLIVYVQKIRSAAGTLTSRWLYVSSSDRGESWSAPRTFDASVLNGLAYGKIFSVPGANPEQIIVTGYYGAAGNTYLGVWSGIADGTGAVNWTKKTPVAVSPLQAGNTPYVHAEHSIQPLTKDAWICVVRGVNGLQLFKTLDGGETWMDQGELWDVAVPRAFHKLVAPMIDLFTFNGEPRLILMYADRSLRTSSKTRTVLRIGSDVNSFVTKPYGRIDWSSEQLVTDGMGFLSGYQTGVLLGGRSDRYLYAEFNERSETQADIQIRLIDLTSMGGLPVQVYEDERVTNVLRNGNFDQWANGDSFDLTKNAETADAWTAVPSGGRILVEKQLSPSNHLRLRITTANDYIGIQQTVSGAISKLTGKAVTMRFLAQSPGGSPLYAHLGRLPEGGTATPITSGQFDVTDRWCRYEFVFRFPSLASAEIGQLLRLTIGFRDSALHELNLDNVVLEESEDPVGTTRIVCP